MNKGFTFVCVSLIMLFISTAPLAAQNADDSNKEYKEVLEQMLEVSGGLVAARNVIPQMVEMLKQQAPSSRDQAYLDAFSEKWTNKFLGEMVERYVPIYQKYLTLDDLKQIVAFYESPVGRKLGAATPSMMKEGMIMGQQLGVELSNEILQDYQENSGK